MKKILCGMLCSGLVLLAQAAQKSERVQQAVAKDRLSLMNAWSEQEKRRVEQDKARGCFAHVYAQPTWQSALNRFDGSQFLGVTYTQAYELNGFDAQGTSVNSSVVRFGAQPTFGDICLASKIATQVFTATPTLGSPAQGSEYLTQMVNTPIPFVASITTSEYALSYTAGFFNNQLQCGLRVPVQQQCRELEVVPGLNSVIQTDLSSLQLGTNTFNNQNFRAWYGVSIPAMIQDVVQQKGMRYRANLSQVAVGDMSFFVTVHQKAPGVERWSLSFEALVPGDKGIANDYFYPLLPESFGCVSGRVTAGMLSEKTAIGLLHMMTGLQVYMPSKVFMRVPRIAQATNVITMPAAEVFGADVHFSPRFSYAVPETTVADFADTVTEVSYQPGAIAEVRFGNVINPFISPLMQLDVYYRFKARTANTLSDELTQSLWYSQALITAGFRTQHFIGFNWTYQPSRHCMVRAGAEAVVGGRSAAQEVRMTVALSGAF